LIRTIVIAALLLVAASAADAAKRVALVIGTDKYSTLPDLNNATTDARGIAAKLKSLGFDVILKRNASRRDFARALDDFEGRLARAEVGLVFYAGHGIQAQGKNWLIPADAEVETEADLRYEGIPAGDFLGAMERAGTKLNIVILDACRDNPLPKRTRSAARGLSVPVIPAGIKGTAILYSAAPGQTAEDGPKGGHGVFTGELLRVLSKPGLTLENVFKETATRVSAATNGRQDPWINSSVKGNFYFKPGDGRAEPAPKPNAGVTSEIVFWQSIQDSKDSADYADYLAQFPKGAFARLAKRRLAALTPPASSTKKRKRRRPPRRSAPTAATGEIGDAQATLDRLMSLIRRIPKASDRKYGTGYIIGARTRLGDLDGALAMARQIHDRSERGYALRHAMYGLVKTAGVEQATEVARSIETAEDRMYAFSALFAHYKKQDDEDGMIRTADAAESAFSLLSKNELYHRFHVAGLLAKAGAWSRANAHFSGGEATFSRLKEDYQRDSGRQSMARELAGVGEVGRATRNARAIATESTRNWALSGIASSIARNDDLEGGADYAREMPNSLPKASAATWVAAAYIEKKRHDEARDLLRYGVQVAAGLSDRFERNLAYKSLAWQLAANGDYREALEVAGRIQDQKKETQRAGALGHIAIVQAKKGQLEDARNTAHAALDASRGKFIYEVGQALAWIGEVDRAISYAGRAEYDGSRAVGYGSIASAVAERIVPDEKLAKGTSPDTDISE